MKLLNRAALWLQPKQGYLDWINSLPSAVSELEQPLAEGALDEEGRIYLVEELEEDQGLEQTLALHCSLVLENELAAWDELGTYWPEVLDQPLLTRWFDIRLMPLAFDAAERPLMTAVL